MVVLLVSRLLVGREGSGKRRSSSSKSFEVFPVSGPSRLRTFGGCCLVDRAVPAVKSSREVPGIHPLPKAPGPRILRVRARDSQRAELGVARPARPEQPRKGMQKVKKFSRKRLITHCCCFCARPPLPFRLFLFSFLFSTFRLSTFRAPAACQFFDFSRKKLGVFKLARCTT